MKEIALLWLSFILSQQDEFCNFLNWRIHTFFGRLWQLKMGLCFLTVGKRRRFGVCSLLPAHHYASVLRGKNKKNKIKKNLKIKKKLKKGGKKTACLEELCEGKLCLISLGNPFCYFLVLLATLSKTLQ